MPNEKDAICPNGIHDCSVEVSEQRPANWRETLPVVLEALRETGAGG